jgi:hypothetical protein
MVVNMVIWKKGSSVLISNVMKNDKVTYKSYLLFIIFVAIIIIINHLLFFYFKNPNLYELVGASRKLSLIELKQFQKQKKI